MAENPGSPPTPGASGSSSAGRSEECKREVALVCKDGLVDGCNDDRTTRHICVARTSTTAPACEAEIAAQCPAGQVDACSLRPAASTRHLCVQAP